MSQILILMGFQLFSAIIFLQREIYNLYNLVRKLEAEAFWLNCLKKLDFVVKVN